MKILEDLTVNSTDDEILALLDRDIPVSQITSEDYFHVYNLVVQNVELPCRYYDESLWTSVRGGALLTELKLIQEIPVQVTESVKNLAVSQYWDYRTSWLDLHWSDKERGDPERILYLKSKEDQKGILVSARNLIGSWGRENPSLWRKLLERRNHIVKVFDILHRETRSRLFNGQIESTEEIHRKVYDHFANHHKCFMNEMDDFIEYYPVEK